jgi:putative ABC transport system permease protein
MFRKRRKASDFDAEIEAHLQLEADRLQEQGMSEAEARRAARRAFGNRTLARERFYESRRWRWWDVLSQTMQDLRFGWRQLRKTRVFTLTAVLSLGLGIGAAVTMFSAFRAVFLRSLPYRNADRIVTIDKLGSHGYTPASTLADLSFLRRYDLSLQSAAWYGFFKNVTLSGISNPADLWVRDVSLKFFSVFGARSILGRTFVPRDFRSGAPETVVLAYDAWQKYFHGDRGIVGQPVFLNGKSYLVIGVMPKDFDFPKVGTAAWLPGKLPESDPQQAYLAIVARLRPGISLDQARKELNRLTPDLLHTYPRSAQNFKLTMGQVALRDANYYRTAFLLLLGATGFLVLLSCLNVASLLLARAGARRHEFAIRGALGGARRTRLIRQVLTESLVLSGLSGALGIGLAYVGNRILLWLLPAYLGIPRLEETRLDLAVLGFAVLLTFVVALLFGLGPALGLSAAKLGGVDRQGRSNAANSWRQSTLVVGEIAIALILLAGSVLMLRGFIRLANVNPGVRTAHILTAMVPPGHAAHLKRPQLAQRYSEILRVAQSVPGVEQAALTSNLPFGDLAVHLQIHIPRLSRVPFQIAFHAVSADYFRVMGIPLLKGRSFSKLNPNMDKGGVVINRAMADKFWPGQYPVGQQLNKDSTVIGVVGNTRHRTLESGPVPEFYDDYRQYLGPAVGTTLVLRTLGDPQSVASSLRQAIHRFDPQQAVENETSMEAKVAQSISKPRFYTILLGIFALLALILTLVGVYGVASYGTSLRTREFGIRMALGADRPQLIRMILGQGLRRAVVGVAAGAAGAWALARLMSGIVYGIPVRDPVSLAVAAAVLITGALVAYYLPARRSTKIDPAAVLRQE